MQKNLLSNNFQAQPLTMQFGLVLLFNTAIAVFFNLVSKEAHIWIHLLSSQCVGLSIFFSFLVFSYFYELKGWRTMIPLSIGAVLGVSLSIIVTGLINGVQLSTMGQAIAPNFDKVLVNLFVAFFFGLIILYFFLSRERQHHASNALKEVQIKNLDHKKLIAETQLQLLQAQIEPHFLFNSLSNVISLIENDSVRAKLMLESLTRYLRASLSRSHKQDGCLKDELDLVENYLKIIQIRMGDRLSYKISVPEILLEHQFPIMLLQPLVENAIHHGLEPMAAGGEIIIDVRQQYNILQIRVMDNGCGFSQENLSGFGLYNVRQRVQSLFGEAGRLKLENNTPRGVCTTIEIPYA